MVKLTGAATKGSTLIDRGESTREAAGGMLERDEHQAYEPPTLTTLGSFAELTKTVKNGPAIDPGDGFQPSVE
jgi:hypothetical protein